MNKCMVKIEITCKYDIKIIYERETDEQETDAPSGIYEGLQNCLNDIFEA